MPNLELLNLFFGWCKGHICNLVIIIFISSCMYIVDIKFANINEHDKLADAKMDKVLEMVHNLTIGQALSAQNAQRLDKLETQQDIDDKRLDKHDTQISILEHHRK
jgi:hypothetical protein